MKRLALVCNPRILYHQYSSGVRSMLCILYYALSKAGYKVDIVCLQKQKDVVSNSNHVYPAKRFDYFSIMKFDENLILENFFINDVPMKKPSLFNFTNWRIFSKNTSVHTGGERIATDLTQYDVIITLVPWLYPALAGRHNAKAFSIVHDCFFTLYKFMYKSGDIIPFSAHVGTEMAIKDGAGVICITDYAKKQIEQCYKHANFYDEKKVFCYTETMVPPAFYEKSCDVKRERAIAIGNIRDRRKRFDYIMDVIPHLKNLDKIYVYGGVTTYKNMSKFFKIVPKNIKIEWYKSASTATVLEILHKAKVLFFPSDAEGLGMPILEAQMCGARVAYQNRSPMNNLAIEGLPLTMNPGIDSKAIDDILADTEFDNLQFKARAHKKYSAQGFIDGIVKIIES